MSCSRTQHSDAGEAQPAALQSPGLHSTPEPLWEGVPLDKGQGKDGIFGVVLFQCITAESSQSCTCKV